MRRTAIAALTALLAAGCSSPTPDPLVVGVAADHPGLALQVQGEHVGLDTQVARYLARDLGVRARTDLELARTSARDRAAAVVGGDVRFAVSSDPVPAVHRGQITEIGPVLVGGLSLAGRRLPDVARLRGQVVCVVGGSAAEAALPRLVPGAVARPVATISTCLTLVADGTAAAALDDDVVLRGYLAGPAYARLTMLPRPLTTQPHTVWVRSGDTDLCRTLTTGLRRMVSSGAWARAVQGDLVSTGVLPSVPAPPAVHGC